MQAYMSFLHPLTTSQPMQFFIDSQRGTSTNVIKHVNAHSIAQKDLVIANEDPEPTDITTSTIQTNPKIYRPKLASQYIEPDICPDLLDGMELLYKDYGSSIRKDTAPLPPRDDVLLFDPDINQTELDKNIRWHQCPPNFQPPIVDIIKEYWDVFCEEGLRRNIRGFSCRIDTGDISPVCCKPPRYGPHESVIMNKLVAQLQHNGLIEDDDGPWGAVIVLAAKHGQENTPWHDYIWRLCVSYRRLNQITRPFKFPILRCDDAVMDISPRAQYFITFDLDSGYWQISLEPTSRAKTAFFTPSGKKRWTVMPMGSLNAMSIFVAMMSNLQSKWNEEAKIAGLHGSYGSDINNPNNKDDYGSTVIADDVALYAAQPDTLLKYFRIVLNVLQHHRVTIKLKKCNFLSPTIEFVGINVGPNGNSPATSKFEALRNLPPPTTWSELRRAIGFLGFYQQWIQQFELRLGPFRKLQHRQPLPGELSLEEEQSFFKGFWLPEHTKLLRELIEDVIEGPSLQRPDASRRFYVKTDWSKDGIGAVLLQADASDESKLAEDIESQGGPCSFDLTRSGLRLRPISFLSRKTTPAEQSYHSYVGEASAGRWAFSKWRKHLFGKEFTWLTDCNGLKQFFNDSTELANHMLQRWRVELLLYNFTIEHRPAAMLTECDMLSRYNQGTENWSKDNTKKDIVSVNHVQTITPLKMFPDSALQSNPRIHTICRLPKQELIGNQYWHKSTVMQDLLVQRNILVDNVIGLPIQETLEELGLASQFNVMGTESNPPKHTNLPGLQIVDMESFYSSLYDTVDTYNIEWFITTYPYATTPPGTTNDNLQKWLVEVSSKISALIKACNLHVVLLFLPLQFPDPLNKLKQVVQIPQSWATRCFTIRNCSHGGAIETDHLAIVLTEQQVSNHLILPSTTSPPTPMASIIPRHMLPTINISTGDLMLTNPSPAYRARCESTLQATAAKLIKNKVDLEPIDGWPIFNIDGPGPSIASTRPEQTFFQGLFAVWYSEPDTCCPVDTRATLMLLGLHPAHMTALCSLPPDVCDKRCRTYPGKEGLKAIVHALAQADMKSKLEDSSSTATNAFVILPDNDFTVLPLPDQNAWQTALQNDPDTALLIYHITNKTPLEEKDFSEKIYFNLAQQNRFDFEEGLLRYYEHSRTARLRQLSLKVVPVSLRRTVIVACHSSPFGGHSGITKTLFRVQTRFWWPGMLRDIREGVRSCAHCNLSNAVSHEAALELHTLSCDVPFDVIFLDIWSPGDIMDKNGTTKVLTMLDCMTSFAMGAFLQGDINSENIANATLSNFFTTVGLPRLIIVDADSVFAGVFKQLFSLLMIPIHQVARENHKAIRNERFHRYLNKVQRINTADTGSLFRWKQGVLFSFYAWNASPIDGTDISRCLVAISRDFPFPIDIEATVMRGTSHEGQQAIDFYDAASPLLYRQRALLNILNAERRQRHIDIRNVNKTTPSFSPGDIVIVRKQVKSDAAQGISAKLLLKTKGPYRVLEQITPSSYNVQKLPFLQGLGVPGRIRKESAARMTKLPSTLVIHKRANGADTRFSQMAGPFTQMPLQKWLNAMTDPGAYNKSTPEKAYAFEPINTLWSDPIDDASDDASDSSVSIDDPTQPQPSIEAPIQLPIPPSNETPAQLPEINPIVQANDEAPMSVTLWPSSNTSSVSTKKVLTQLYRSICDSADRIFFIVGAPSLNIDGPMQPNAKRFSIAQVWLNETDPVQAKTAGLYKMKLWTQNLKDQHTRSLSQSRFCPALESVNQTVNKYHPIRPDKVQQVLSNDQTLRWHLFDVPLSEVRIIGPIEFQHKRIGLRGPKRQAVSETHHIDEIYWQQLEQKGGTLGVSVDNIWTLPNPNNENHT
jgi:hypothetical protein